MSHKKVMVVVDNRAKAMEESCAQLRGVASTELRGSAFKATEVDVDEEMQSGPISEVMWISQLQKRVEELEGRVAELEKHGCERLRKKKRRKASEIERSFVCHFSQCGKIYGSDTSLKNHLKIKHKSEPQCP